MKYQKTKTIIEFDEGLLDEYNLFKKANDRWTILSYLTHKYTINDALALSKLFFPDFEEVKSCVVLSFLYNEKIFDDWYNEFKGEVANVEKMVNLYELADLFHINEKNFDEEQLIALGNLLKKSWEINLKCLYSRDFRVAFFEENGAYFITFYSL